MAKTEEKTKKGAPAAKSGAHSPVKPAAKKTTAAKASTAKAQPKAATKAAEPKTARKTAAPARRVVARPVTRVARRAEPARPREAAREEQPKRKKVAARALPPLPEVERRGHPAPQRDAAERLLPGDEPRGAIVAAFAQRRDRPPQLEPVAFAEGRLAERLAFSRQAQLDRERVRRERLGAHSSSRRSCPWSQPRPRAIDSSQTTSWAPVRSRVSSSTLPG